MITAAKPVRIDRGEGFITIEDTYTGCNIQFTIAGAEDTWRRLKDAAEKERIDAAYPMRSNRNARI